ncbi:GNAT family N-acetyltransferase [Streptomyces triticiradicis]|uniref:GNAT family N-acetyltransferase n=1 Tax=Streptomyces triticiradicis TaxID=2651189 RepID=A0A7J5DAR0_9ACTN|nr:GNAT family N-acetyltransferase [Streptomyces triticiradicis]KAB1985864.1 GNAT family N-acetyltransferase [Streptomyces triticiradicis]
MPRIERLRADHAPALLAFERENRAYFAATIPDRGDTFFDRFDALLGERLDEQAAGLAHFHLVADDDGTVLARVNLVDVAHGSADLGYRVAERAAGRGLATAAVRKVCALAASAYGLRVLRAAATTDNAASRKVLARAGFLVTGRTELNGRPALRFARELPAAGAVPAAGRAGRQESGSTAGLIGD